MEGIIKEKKGEHPLGDAGQLILMAVFLVVWAVDSFFLHLSTFLSAYVPLFVRLVILVITFIIALYLFRSSHVVLESEQRPERVITNGVFGYVRHPLYLGGMLIYLGMGIATLSLFSLVVLIGIFIFYNYIAGYEEKVMERKFGEEYVKYKQRTGKWLPRIGGS